MSLALTVLDHWSDTRRIHLVASLLASGSYATGGDSIPFSNPLIKSSTTPVLILPQVNIGGYTFIGVPGSFGSSPATGKLQIFVTATGLELAAAAYPAAITAALIQLYAIFSKV